MPQLTFQDNLYEYDKFLKNRNTDSEYRISKTKKKASYAGKTHHMTAFAYYII